MLTNEGRKYRSHYSVYLSRTIINASDFILLDVYYSLPASVIRSDSLSVFKSRLKTFLFRGSFN